MTASPLSTVTTFASSPANVICTTLRIVTLSSATRMVTGTRLLLGFAKSLAARCGYTGLRHPVKKLHGAWPRLTGPRAAPKPARVQPPRASRSEPGRTEVAVDYVSRAPRLADGPVALDALVPGAGGLELEIGFGRGMFLLGRACAAPEARLVGLEVKAKLVVTVHERLARRSITNARVFMADAREVLARAGPDACLQRVYLHFPDPWWKKRHAKRRILDDTLLGAVVRLLAPEGELFVQTDVEDRAHEFRAQLRACDGLVLGGDDGWVNGNPYGAVSNRERRAVRDGLPVWRLLARRSD